MINWQEFNMEDATCYPSVRTMTRVNKDEFQTLLQRAALHWAVEEQMFFGLKKRYVWGHAVVYNFCEDVTNFFYSQGFTVFKTDSDLYKAECPCCGYIVSTNT